MDVGRRTCTGSGQLCQAVFLTDPYADTGTMAVPLIYPTNITAYLPKIQCQAIAAYSPP